MMHRICKKDLHQSFAYMLHPNSLELIVMMIEPKRFIMNTEVKITAIRLLSDTVRMLVVRERCLPGEQQTNDEWSP